MSAEDFNQNAKTLLGRKIRQHIAKCSAQATGGMGAARGVTNEELEARDMCGRPGVRRSPSVNRYAADAGTNDFGVRGSR